MVVGGLTLLNGGGLANSLRVRRTSEYPSNWLSLRRRSPHMSGKGREMEISPRPAKS